MIIFLLILIVIVLIFGRQAGIWFFLGSLALLVIGIIIAILIHVDSSNNVAFVPANPPVFIPDTTAQSPKTKAVSATPKTGYQVCGDMNATWDGTSYTSGGEFSCTCKTGYVHPSSPDGKSCVIATVNGYAPYNPAQYGASQSTPSFYNPYAQDVELAKQQEAASCAAAAANAKNMDAAEGLQYMPQPCY
jgi:hypothetical protein